MGRRAVYGDIPFSCLGVFFKSYRVSSAMGALKEGDTWTASRVLCPAWWNQHLAELAEINDPKANKVMRSVIEPRRQGGSREGHAKVLYQTAVAGAPAQQAC